MSLNLDRARQCLKTFDFAKLFINELGWSRSPSKKRATIQVNGGEYGRTGIAELSGVVVFEIDSATGKIPDAPDRTKIHKEITKLHHENILVFVDANRSQSLWYWVKRQNGKNLVRSHLWDKEQPGDLFLSKISAMCFDITEFDSEGSVPLVEVTERLSNALDVERVTRKFYKEYEDQRLAFVKLIKGISSERDRHWYASVLLNRLMFIYFLQRKHFLDNADRDYLQNKLATTKKRGNDKYYSEFLKVLFFEGFAVPSEQRTKRANKILGDIKYLNGGLFLPHEIEQKYSDIDVPDKAFENLLDLFARYSWNLDDTPGGDDNEINPDVLGYIFEKYINQKAFGAYYTRPQITEYLCHHTIHRLVLDGVNNGTRQFDTVAEMLMNLDAQLCRQLVHDILPELKLLDPACGSGAFLIAAMKTLVDIYAAVIGKIRFLNDKNLSQWLAKIEKQHPSISYFVKKSIITDNLFGVDIMEEATEIAKLRLFLALVASVHTVDHLESLPNIDFNIVAGNSLVGLMHVDDKEFNRRNAQGNLFHKSYHELLAEKNRLIESFRHATTYAEDLTALRDEIQEKKTEAIEMLNQILLDEFKSLGIKYEDVAWDAVKNKKGKSTKRDVQIGDVAALLPFHWGYEFDEILHKSGGFDAIITNPPWEIFKPNAKEFFLAYSDLVSKKKMTLEDFEQEQARILSDEEVREAWENYLSGFPHISQYYRHAKQYQHQISLVDGKKVGSDINLYRLFTEQCCNLLRKGGHCGLVIPSGIYNDLGTKGLRLYLLDECTISGMICFENRKEIFEGVHRSYKFVVLTFGKGGETNRFPVEFMRTDVSALEGFPSASSMYLSTRSLRKLSPRSLSIMEFNNKRELEIVEKLLRFPNLGTNIKNSWNVQFTREVNNMSHMKYTSQRKRSPLKALLEGKMIHQYDSAFEGPRYYIDVKRFNSDVSTKWQEKYPSDYYRLCFRRQARSTDSYTFIGTVVPPNALFFDNLGYVKPFDLEQNRLLLEYDELMFLCACLNSYVLQFMLRMQINANLSFYFLYQLPVPRLSTGNRQFDAIVDKVGKLVCIGAEFDALAKEIGIGSHKRGVQDVSKRGELRAELEAAIAHLYSLTESELTYVLSTFPLTDESVKSAVLRRFLQMAPTLDDVEVRALIGAGEGAETEFKSSARWDIREKRKSKELERVVVKTVAGFMNARGGTLLIGVDDDGNVIGLADDFQTVKKKNRDGYQLFLGDLLYGQLGKDLSKCLDISFHVVDGCDVCILKCAASARPVYVIEGNSEELYVRIGNSTRKLSSKEAIDYAKERWTL